MSKKTRTVSNKAGKLMKCDGQMLKKVIEAKGYKCHELSKMLRYCSDYLTTCCRTNKISDVAAKYLMDYKIFPQMYDLEGDAIVNVPEPKEVKIDRDSIRSPFAPTAQEIKKVLNEKYGKLEKDAKGIDYGYDGPTPKNTSYCSFCAGNDIAKGVFKLMQATIDELKHDPEFKEMIKQAVKEAYEEL